MFRTTDEWAKERAKNPLRQIESTSELVAAAIKGGKKKRQFIVALIEYSFDMEDTDNVEFERYLEFMREVGSAEVISVELVEKDC